MLWKTFLYLHTMRAFQVYYDECAEEAYLTFDEERYNMYQTHFHSPSEHAVSDKNQRKTIVRASLRYQ